LKSGREAKSISTKYLVGLEVPEKSVMNLQLASKRPCRGRKKDTEQEGEKAGGEDSCRGENRQHSEIEECPQDK